MDGIAPEQASVRCVLMRGGTSKGLYFHERDLPPPGSSRDKLLLRLMGSPDVLQIDGLGGSRPITSKLAIIGRPTRADADVDYTFGQVEIDRGVVAYTSNCGNISAGVGPFAVDEGMVAACEGMTRVRIHNTNTRKILVADVPVHHGKAKVEGSYAIPGVPGTGAEILMNWADTVGSKTGALLPTGHPVDRIVLEDGRTVAVTLCDAGNPCAWAPAAAFGLSGSELSHAINGDARLIAVLREFRGKAAVLYGFCRDWRRADEDAPVVPMVGFVAPAADYETLSGGRAQGAEMDLRVRLMFMNRLHESIAGAGMVCVAAASRIPGTVVHDIARQQEGMLRIGHPSGVTATRVRTRPSNEPPFIHFEELAINRTARRLMSGSAYYPSSLLREDEHPTPARADSIL